VTGIAWVGLGTIAGHHLDACAHAPDVGRPVAGYDIDPDARKRFAQRIATAGSLDELLSRIDVDVIVVGTPTPTHDEVCRAVIERGAPRTLLVEKPIATTLDDVRELFRVAARADVELRGIYHAAYAPEVEWALANLEEQLRDVVRIEAEFVDPQLQPAIYGDSWLDSGINALSIIARFVRIDAGEIRSVASPASTFEAAFAGAVPISIRTSWGAPEPSKVTRFHLRDGGAVVLDHQAMTVRSAYGCWTSDSSLPRLTQHYVAALRHATSPSSESPDLELHRLLLESR
jgi:hypothetical protein